MTQKKKIIVIGAGAAGLMAACAAADGGAEVTVLEHNEKAGKKIYITGKGRCNYTNACETEEFFSNVLRNPKFLYSAVYGFDSSAVTEFLEKNGCATKEERGKRCFPASDHAFDVTDALVRHLRKNNGRIRFHADVAEIRTEKEAGAETEAAGKGGKELRRTTGVRLRSGEELFADAVIVAAGCYVQTSEKEVLNDLSVDIVIGNDRKHDLVRLLEEYSLDSVNDTVDDINDGKHDFEELFIDQTKEHTRAFIKVQDGCNQFCSYCIIPYARGRVRSRRFENVIAEVGRLAANGFKEVVLTSI